MGLEVLGEALRRRDETESSDFVMPIGKHRGKLLRHIDSHYLTWFIHNVPQRHEVRYHAVRELTARVVGG